MRLKAAILSLILCCSACVSYGELRITDRVYAPVNGASGQSNWRRSYKVKYLAPAKGSENAVVMEKATAMMYRGQYREAVAILSKVSPTHSDADRVYNNLAVGFEVLGEREKSLAYYAAACRLAPKNPYYRENLNSL